MSIKRLKHHAYNLGQMFCGWELMFDYQRLAEMERGTLRIDMLTGRCLHNGVPIDGLRIVRRLRDWMERDLAANRIERGRVRLVELEVEFSTSRQPGQQLWHTSWQENTPYFVRCAIDCRSRVAIAHREFTASYSDIEEWPESYSWIREQPSGG